MSSFAAAVAATAAVAISSDDNTLVWVTTGTTQHPAILLQEKGVGHGVNDDEEEQDNDNNNNNNNNQQCLIRWTSNNKTEWVSKSQIEEQPSPRRRLRRRRIEASSSLLSLLEEESEELNDSTESSSSSSSSSYSSSSSVRSSPKKRRRKSLSSSSSSPQSSGRIPQHEKQNDYDDHDHEHEHPHSASTGAVGEAKIVNNATTATPTTCSDKKKRSTTTTTTVTTRYDSKMPAIGKVDNMNDVEEKEEAGQQENNNSSNDDDDDDDEVEFLLTIKPNYAQQQQQRQQQSSDDDDDDDDNEVEFISSLSLNEIMARARDNNNNSKNAAAAATATAAEPSSVVQTTTGTMIINTDVAEATSHSSTTSLSLPAMDVTPATASSSARSVSSNNITAAATTRVIHSSSIDSFRCDNSERRQIMLDDRKLCPARVSEVGIQGTSTTQRQEQLSSAASSSSSSSLQLLQSSSLAPPSSSSYPLISSAHLQNLAEICSIICNDARWRVSDPPPENNKIVVPEQSPLFRWEDGDELSAVSALQQLYQPLQPQSSRRRSPSNCCCLLCRDNQRVDKPDDSKEQPVGQEEDDLSLSAVSLTTTTTDDNDIRWLYLYCRLFYRRGPWFRVDDLYERYYKPKVSTVEPPRNETKSPASDASAGEEQSANADTASSAGSATRFKEQNSKKRAAAALPVVDESILLMYMDRLNDVFHDLSRLQAAGLVRSFHGEEECGKTVGVSVLTQDLRTIVLSKLGGTARKNKQQGRPQKKWQERSTYATQQPKKLENEIWNQMQRQKSIFASSNAGGSEKSLLPVCKHVDDVILQKLVTDILKISCAIPSNAHLPVAISRTWANQLRAKIRQTAKTVGLLSTTTSMTCFRLREKPTLALQRCCRLFLCATNGPGQMRGTKTALFTGYF
jgi:hypothetical protein